MIMPFIRIDSATGSDSASSGAGPGDGVTAGTKLSGTGTASTDATGLIVTLPGGTDLSGVLADGTHAIWINDTTANNRNFGRITAVDNTAKTLGVHAAFAANLTAKDWAIGGKRASLFSTSSRRLMDTGGTNLADCEPGWRIRFSLGHAETIGTSLFLRRLGTAAAAIILDAEPGVGVAPTFTITANNHIFNANGVTNYDFDGLRFRCTSGTKTSCYAIQNPGFNVRVTNCLADDASAAVGGLLFTGSNAVVESNRVVSSAAAAIYGGMNVRFNELINCAIGYRGPNSIAYQPVLAENLFRGCARGVSIETSSTSSPTSNNIIRDNTFDSCTGEGIAFTATAANAAAFAFACVENNIFTRCGTGISFDASIVVDTLQNARTRIRFNTFGTGSFANTLNITAAVAARNTSPISADPSYADPLAGNFRIGITAKGTGYPDTPIGGTGGLTLTYKDPGCAQRDEGVVIQPPTLVQIQAALTATVPTTGAIATAVAAAVPNTAAITAAVPNTSAIAAAVAAAVPNSAAITAAVPTVLQISTAILATPADKINNTGGKVRLQDGSISVTTFDETIATGPAGTDPDGVTTLLAQVATLLANFPTNFPSLAITTGGLVSLNYAQTGLTIRDLSNVADAALTTGDGIVAMIAEMAGDEAIAGTSWTKKTPAGTTVRTFTLAPDATNPTSRT